jgi:hypothetical protein
MMARKKDERILLFGTAAAFLFAVTAMSRHARAATPAPAPTQVPFPRLRLLGKTVTGVVPGARYQIVGFTTPEGMGVPNPGNVVLEVVSYPPRPDVEGNSFPLQRTIERFGLSHPTVTQVATLIAEAASGTALGRSIWHNVNPAAIRDLQARERARLAQARYRRQSPLSRERADAALYDMEQEYEPLTLDEYEDAGWSFGA